MQPRHAAETAGQHTPSRATHYSDDSCGRVIRPDSANAVTIVYGLPVFAIPIVRALTCGFDRERHHRKSIRLRGYNYAAPGAYFITIDTHDRACLFGEIARCRMHLSAAGMAAQTAWAAIPAHFPRVRLDAFVVMPNHVHGVIVIVGTMPETDDAMSAPDDADASVSGDADGYVPGGHGDASASGHGDASASGHGDASASGHGDASALVRATHASPLRSPPYHPHGPPRDSIGAIIGAYKSAVSRHINRLHGTRDGVVWQRNYYERIIRDYPSLQRVRKYICANPRNWKGRR